MEFPPVDSEILLHYRSRFPGMTKVDGVPRHQGMMDLANFEMRDDDILVTGYPKSGTHWLAEIVLMIKARGDETEAKRKPLMERFHRLELDPVDPSSDSVERFSSVPSPRVLMTHSPYRQGPPKQRKYKTVVIVRNPKDVAASFFMYHRTLRIVRYDRSWKDFLSLFVNGEVMHGLWFDVVLDWWSRRNDPDVYFVKYEDLIKDLPVQVVRLGKFLGVSLESEQETSIVKHCRFETMKGDPMCKSLNQCLDESVSQFLRKGVVGDWKNFFTEDQSETFDKLYQKYMKDSGLELEFE